MRAPDHVHTLLSAAGDVLSLVDIKTGPQMNADKHGCLLLSLMLKLVTAVFGHELNRNVLPGSRESAQEKSVGAFDVLALT